MDTEVTNAFGKLLRKHRRAASLTQEALGALAGLSARAIQDLENGRRQPLLDTVQRLLRALPISEAAKAEFAASVLPSAMTGAVPLHPGSSRILNKEPPFSVVIPLTSFVGREKELDEVARLLATSRLLTVTGPPGVGKTRLAQEVAIAEQATYSDGVIFVSLSPLSDPALLLPTIARAYGVREKGNQPLAETLWAALRDRHTLLVLDNFEHVAAAAPEVADLLSACTHLRVLVTSRATLRVRGEQVYPLSPLAVPASDAQLSAEALGVFPAVRLFADRARAASPEFTISDDDTDAVAELCRRLDGLPLAIELAAARSRVMSPGTMVARLTTEPVEDPQRGARTSLQWLRGGGRDLPERQRALVDAIGWSYDLLPPPERALFRRLGVFVGGCTVGAVEAVCDVDGDLGMAVLDGLESLVEASLLRSDRGQAGEPRYSMLETLLAYALERLEECGEVAATRQRHTATFLKLAEDAEPGIRSKRQAWWLERLEAEHGNIRAAITWGLAQSDAGEMAARLAGALRWFWLRSGRWSEGRGCLEAALARAEPGAATVARANALDVAGNITWRQGDNNVARSMCERSVAMWRTTGDRQGLAYALCHLWLTVAGQGDYSLARCLRSESVSLLREHDDAWGLAYVQAPLLLTAILDGDNAAARTAYAESAALFREIGDHWGLGIALGSLGHVAYLEGDYASARERCEESLALRRESGDRGFIATELERLGNVALAQHDHPRAVAWYVEGLATFRELGDTAGVARTIAGLAWANSTEENAERTIRLIAAADARLVATGHAWHRWMRDQHAHSIATARFRLGDATFINAWDSGQALTLEQAVAEVLDEVAPVGLQIAVEGADAGSSTFRNDLGRQMASL